MGGGGNTTSVSKYEPPAYMMPYIQDMLAKGNSVANRPYQANPYQQVAGMNGDMNNAVYQTRDRALNGDAGVNNASYLNNVTMGGAYLDQGRFKNQMAGVDNPYLNQAIANANQDITRSYNQTVAPQNDANFARAGAFGGSAWQNATAENNRQLAGELAKADTGMRMQDYGQQQQLAENFAARNSQAFQNERDRQQAGIANAQSLAQLKAGQTQDLFNMGLQQQKQAQNELNNAYDTWNDSYNYPLQQLELLQKLVQAGSTGSTRSLIEPRNSAASGLGGALAGLGAAGKYFPDSGNLGKGIGAVLGAASSYY